MLMISLLCMRTMGANVCVCVCACVCVCVTGLGCGAGPVCEHGEGLRARDTPMALETRSVSESSDEESIISMGGRRLVSGKSELKRLLSSIGLTSCGPGWPDALGSPC